MHYPGAGDKAVIFSGRTVTMTNNSTSVSSVTVEGILDLAATTGHTFSNIAGGGKIRISTADIFPSYSTNTLFTTDRRHSGILWQWFYPFHTRVRFITSK